MTLAPLATELDLINRNIAIPTTDSMPLLLSASDAVRDAAGCAITSTTSTIQLPASDDAYLDLPAGPVTAVSSVAIGTDAPLVVDVDYVVMADTLVRIGGGPGWLSPNTIPPFRPVMVNIVYTHGLAVCPADIVDLVCSIFAVAAAQITDETYGVQSLVQQERLADYSITYEHGAGVQSSQRSPSPVTVPEGTRNWLRSRFGNSVGVIGNRR